MRRRYYVDKICLENLKKTYRDTHQTIKCKDDYTKIIILNSLMNKKNSNFKASDKTFYLKGVLELFPVTLHAKMAIPNTQRYP